MSEATITVTFTNGKMDFNCESNVDFATLESYLVRTRDEANRQLWSKNQCPYKPQDKVYLVYIEDSNGILSRVLGIADSIEGVQIIAGEDISRAELCSEEYEVNERVDDKQCKYEASDSDPLAQRCILTSHNRHYL